jgi:hypothetical protein
MARTVERNIETSKKKPVGPAGELAQVGTPGRVPDRDLRPGAPDSSNGLAPGHDTILRMAGHGKPVRRKAISNVSDPG